MHPSDRGNELNFLKWMKSNGMISGPVNYGYYRSLQDMNGKNYSLFLQRCQQFKTELMNYIKPGFPLIYISKAWNALFQIITRLESKTLFDDLECLALCNHINVFADNTRVYYQRINHCPHYLHILMQHVPQFINHYRTLAIFSQEGHEGFNKSLHSSFMNHSARGGGSLRKSEVSYQVYSNTKQAEETLWVMTLYQMLYFLVNRVNQYEIELRRRRYTHFNPCIEERFKYVLNIPNDLKRRKWTWDENFYSFHKAGESPRWIYERSDPDFYAL